MKVSIHLKLNAVIFLYASLINSPLFANSHEPDSAINCELNKEIWENNYFYNYKDNRDKYLANLRHCLKEDGFVDKVDILSVSSLESLYKAENKTAYAAFIKDSLQEAAEFGHPSSQHNYAAIHNGRFGSTIYEYVDHNYYTFLYWTRKAAAQGEPRALYNLSERLQQDDLIPFIDKDIEKAALILKYLADGIANSAITLPVKYETIIKKYKKLSRGLSKNAKLNLAELAPSEEYRVPIHLKGGFYPSDMRYLKNPGVTMILYRDGSSLEGYYFYDSAYKKWKSRFELKGEVVGDKVNLTAFNQKGVKEETFLGNLKISGDQMIIEAVWSRGNERSQKVIFANSTLFDFHLTCDEMKHAGELAFYAAAGDLGSGRGSSQKIDYNCEGSLYTTPELQKIYTLADDIRAGKKWTSCDGSGWYRKNRHSKRNLLRASFAPGMYNKNKHQRPIKNTYSYLYDWSKLNAYNYELYNAFITELGEVEPLLRKYYLDRYSIDEDTAQEYAELAIDSYVNYAGGSYYYDWKPSVTDKSPIAAILENRPLPEIKELIDQAGGLELALHHSSNNLEITEYLINNGSKVDVENYFGKTALYYAIQFSNLNVVKLLIENGANVNHQYKSKEELYGEEKWVCRYINKTLRTPLMHAAQHSNPQIIKFLLQHGADLNMKDENGDTALDYALEAGRDDNVQLLKSHHTVTNDAEEITLNKLTRTEIN